MRRVILGYVTGVIALAAAASTSLGGDPLADQFLDPPEATKPWCYWYWLKSDVTSEGITKDLEAMAKAGIRLAMLGNIQSGGHLPGPVKMFTPEWRALTRHALAEAGRLGIEIYMFNGPGWSQSGGPWIKPEQSMRRVIWNEIETQGGRFSAKVRNAPQDIAVLAVPRKPAISETAVVSRGKIRFSRGEPWTARGLSIVPKSEDFRVSGTLHALDDSGARTLLAEIEIPKPNIRTDFLPMGAHTFSFKETTARTFEFESKTAAGSGEATLTSEPLVAGVVQKQLGRMHPTPTPTWESYIFPATQEPGDPGALAQKSGILILSDHLDNDGVLTCELPAGDWTILYFGMITTGRANAPAPPEGRGLECDKMSREHVRHHFRSMFDPLIEEMTPAERKAFTGVNIDSYEVGAQNWTDGFAGIFEKRNGYDPIPMLPVLTGRVIESAAASDGFLWDLRRTVADMVSENYVGGLREVAAEYGLRTWCENYGHWGFPGDFLMYGGYADQIGGEFWFKKPLGAIECRAASSAGHTYGKNIIYAEAFTSTLDQANHPSVFKRRGEEMFCEGINHFVLHVTVHQPRDGVPGLNPTFGMPFHRNTPWFNHARNWVRYLQRCHLMLQQGDPVAETAVYIGDFAPQMTGPANPVPEGYDYDYIGSDALLRIVQVENGQFVIPDESDPKRIASRYKLVAVPELALQRVRPQVQARLEALKKAGGTFVHEMPVPAETLQAMSITQLVSGESCPIRWKARRLDEGMLFFLCNFENAGAFEVTLRAQDMVPELFDPVSGSVRRPARYWADGHGTRVAFNVRDPSDSCFVVFRQKATNPSVLKAESDGKLVSAADLECWYDGQGNLTADAASPGKYILTMSDGTQRTCLIESKGAPLNITSPWKKLDERDGGFTSVHETTFNLPAAYGMGSRVLLDLGQVNVMAAVTLNGKPFETLWTPPFELDVTGALKSGDNHLLLEVTSTSQSPPAFGPQVKLRPILSGTAE